MKRKFRHGHDADDVYDAAWNNYPCGDAETLLLTYTQVRFFEGHFPARFGVQAGSMCGRPSQLFKSRTFHTLAHVAPLTQVKLQRQLTELLKPRLRENPEVNDFGALLKTIPTGSHYIGISIGEWKGKEIGNYYI